MKYFILLFFFVLQLVGFTQPKNQPLAVVANTKMNVIYKYIPNPIAIAVPGYFARDLVVKVDVGTIDILNYDYIYYSNNKEKNEVTFSVLVKLKNKKLKLISSSRFSIREIAKPNITFGKYSGGILNYEKLQTINALVIGPLEIHLCDVSFRTKEFKVKHIKTNGDSSIFQCNEMILTKEIKDSFKKAEDGDTIIVYDITIYGPSGIEKRKDELLFVIQK